MVTVMRTAMGPKNDSSLGFSTLGSPSSSSTSCIGRASSRVTAPVVDARCSAPSISPKSRRLRTTMATIAMARMAYMLNGMACRNISKDPGRSAGATFVAS
jgi:hypothetical protein